MKNVTVLTFGFCGFPQSGQNLKCDFHEKGNQKRKLLVDLELVWSRITMWALVFMDITKLISIISLIVWSADQTFPRIFEQLYDISAISSLWQLCPIIVFLCHVELNENDNFDIRKGLYFNKTLPKAQRTRGLSSYHRISIKHKLQNLNQTSASRLKLELKSWSNLASEYFNFVTSTKHQQQNTDQNSAPKSRLNFNFKILTKPCAQSLNKSLALWPTLSS